MWFYSYQFQISNLRSSMQLAGLLIILFHSCAGKETATSRENTHEAQSSVEVKNRLAPLLHDLEHHQMTVKAAEKLMEDS